MCHTHRNITYAVQPKIQDAQKTNYKAIKMSNMTKSSTHIWTRWTWLRRSSSGPTSSASPASCSRMSSFSSRSTFSSLSYSLPVTDYMCLYQPSWLWLRRVTFTCVGWQVTLWSLWQVTSHGSEIGFDKELYAPLTIFSFKRSSPVTHRSCLINAACIQLDKWWCFSRTEATSSWLALPIAESTGSAMVRIQELKNPGEKVNALNG